MCKVTGLCENVLLFFIVVAQSYQTDVNIEYAIRGNSAIIKCQIPSFVADFVSVVSWHTEQGDDFYPNSDFGNHLLTVEGMFVHLL